MSAKSKWFFAEIHERIEAHIENYCFAYIDSKRYALENR